MYIYFFIFFYFYHRRFRESELKQENEKLVISADDILLRAFAISLFQKSKTETIRHVVGRMKY